MTQIICAIQQKGGAGKSTMLSCLSAVLAGDRAKVLIIDTDPQASCIDWAKRKDIENVDTLALLDEGVLESAINRYRSKYDVILIDTAGYDSQMALFAVEESDLVLIPAGGSRKDIHGAAKTWSVVKKLTKKFQKPPLLRIVFWGVRPNTGAFETAKAAMKQINIETVSGSVGSLTGFDGMSWAGGLPTGAAAKAVNGFMASLQTDGLLEFYNQDSSAEKGGAYGKVA